MRWTTAILVGAILLLAAVPVASADGPQKPITRGELKEITFVHYAKPEKPQPPPEPTPVDNTYFELLGLYLPETFSYSINSQGAPAGAVTEVDQSFAAWDAAVNSQLFASQGSTTKSGTALDGQNTVSWVRIAPKSTIALTRIWYNPNLTDSRGYHPIVEADIVFNTFLVWGIDLDGQGPMTLTGAFDVRNIATHEVGHVVGLGDLYDLQNRELTMYGYGAKGETLKISLEAGDIAGAQALYP